jgi:glycosyltransferase involved in cell wall biosynthesis
MTTFIDFRYSRTLATAMFSGQEKEEVSFSFAPSVSNYIAVEITEPIPGMHVFNLVGNDGAVMGTAATDSAGAVSLRRLNGNVLLETPPKRTSARKHQIIAFRFDDNVTGVKLDGAAYETPESIFPDAKTPLRLQIEDEVRVRIMGRGSGRATVWARLFYHRVEAASLGVELAMDWHHLRAGIPLFSTMTAEKLIEQGRFRLKFRSYAYEQAEAESTDFMKLFEADIPVDIAVHMSPPLYAQHVPGTPNLGFFVVESMDIHPDLIQRCNRMDAISVPSRFAGEALRRAGVERPVRIVPHGVDTNYFRPVIERQPLPGGRRFNFLAVATHVERKNAQTLVRAFLEEFREREDVALFLFLRPEYHGSQNNVALEFTGWERRYARNSAPILFGSGYRTLDNLRNLYANADGYVMPSNEGFGLTLLEAMACGTPVIGLKYGGVLDFLNEQNGYLVPAGRAYVARDIDTLPYVGDHFYQPDIRKLRVAMRRVFENKAEARRKAAQARRDCEDRFTWDAVTGQFAELIEETHARAVRCTAKPYQDSFSWVLGVMDDEPVESSLRYMKRKKSGSTPVLCLFTRYARPKDVIQARKEGFMFYRWDGTVENCRAIARSVLGRGWIVLLYPGKKINGCEDTARHFLAAQPAGITEVQVICGDGRHESRFFRLGPPRNDGRLVFFADLSIGKT